MSKSLKIQYNDDIRRRPISENNILEEIVSIAAELFELPKHQIVIFHNERPIISNDAWKKIVSEENVIKCQVKVVAKQETPKQTEQPVQKESPVVPPQQQKPQQPQQQSSPFGFQRVPNSESPFQNLFSQFGQQQSNIQSSSNPLSSLLSFLPLLTGGFNNNNNNNNQGSPFFSNVQGLLSIFQKNLPEEELKQLLISVVQTIPRETLQSIIQNALNNEEVRGHIVKAILSTIDKISGKNEKEEERKRQEEEENKKREEEQQRSLLAKQKEEAARKIDFEKEQLRIREQKEREQKEQKEREQIEREIERIREQREQQERELDLQFQKAEEEKKKQEEIEKKRQEEMEESKRKQEEFLREQQEKLLKQQKEQELQKQELLKQQQKQHFVNFLASKNIPSSALDALIEMGLVEIHGYQKVVELLVKHQGNVERTTEELFN